MKVETRFDKGDFVFVIDEDEIVKVPVHAVDVRNGAISYELLKKEGKLLGDKNSYITKSEENCFGTVMDLAFRYGSKLDCHSFCVAQKAEEPLGIPSPNCIGTAMVNLEKPGLWEYFEKYNFLDINKKYEVMDAFTMRKSNQSMYSLKNDSGDLLWISGEWLLNIELKNVAQE